MIVPPGSTIGIIGGGQLGRMLAMAAANLGYRCHIYAPEPSGPAADVSARWVQGAYDDAQALARFVDGVDIVTYEFENVPAPPLSALASAKPVRPGVRALEIAQDRVAEKDFVAGLGGRPAPYRAVASRDELHDALADLGAPAILKSRRFGYDGKGQARIASDADADSAWASLGDRPCVLEGFVTFGAEFSVILARGADGAIMVWDAPENVHEHGVLATSIVPASPLIQGQAEEAIALARRIADALDYVGVLTLEFFASAAGPVFNEMAPRVHNSGHWTIEGAVTSQFENHVRAICGLPLGATGLAATRVEMQNLIGDEASGWPAILGEPTAHLHLYGKGHPRPGRKMGHVTRLFFEGRK
jgi:5-(carboxyamino)imidazole ribonucleotide synthase